MFYFSIFFSEEKESIMKVSSKELISSHKVLLRKDIPFTKLSEMLIRLHFSFRQVISYGCLDYKSDKNRGRK